jgi:hypothetical protein
MRRILETQVGNVEPVRGVEIFCGVDGSAWCGQVRGPSVVVAKKLVLGFFIGRPSIIISIFF